MDNPKNQVVKSIQYMVAKAILITEAREDLFESEFMNDRIINGISVHAFDLIDK